MVTTCLRLEQCDSEAEFLCQMFQHIPQDLQHRLLVMTADHSEDTMEHCKLLLLLLRRFPQTIATHGVCTLKYQNYFIKLIKINMFRFFFRNFICLCNILATLGGDSVNCRET